MRETTGRGTRRESVLWTHQDFVKVAQHLVQRYPEQKLDQAESLNGLAKVGRAELEDAMREALPAHLHKRVAEPWRFKPGVLRALRSIKHNTDGPSGAVHWNKEEWVRFAVLLQATFPHVDFLRSPDLKQLTASQLNEAASKMPVARQRFFQGVTPQLTAKLLAAYRTVLEQNDQAKTRQEAGPAAPAVPAPKITQPGVTSRHGQHRVYWSADEWLAVAAELVRQNPRDDFPTDVLLKRLSAPKIEAAQAAVLPRERWRHSLKNIKSMMSPLREALNRLHRQMKAEQAEPAPLSPAAPALAPAPAPAAIAPLPAPQPAENTPFDSAFQQACRPLAELMARELAGQAIAQALLPQLLTQLVPALVPQLLAGLQPALEAALKDQLATFQPARPLPFLPPARPEAARPQPVTAPKTERATPVAPRLPVVGVVGPLPAQQRVLEAAFPQIKLLFVESDRRGGNVCNVLRSCVRVVGMTSFLNHSVDGALRKHFQRRYTRVTGGVSAIQHQIDVWLKSGALNEQYADMEAS
ncbi:MAG: hypothetical protein ACXWVD_00455 [Telluria sp.]